ncbi:hypothetical protein GWI33_017180 [Rhynchophorus ferrugineus]|uniref:FLYWCH-type domain-containing protein n=1 Tax=Rhynchophorus ferrugineus TaxID=354439 RepID=A0A834HYM2_RHYFE|nr:hypothetical protein GWI33_017180 [Rhynchophorus ferrugineus]
MECYLADGYYYRYQYDQLTNNSVWGCAMPNCFVKVITDKKKNIIRLIGPHPHRNAKKPPKQKKRFFLEEWFRTQLEKFTTETDKLRRIKRGIETEVSKIDFDRCLRNSVLRSLFLFRVLTSKEL